MVIIVFGPSASGKTTVGRALADALGWAFIEGDDFHPPDNIARMKAGKPLSDKERAPWLAALAAFITAKIGEGTSAVVACSALKRNYRATLVPSQQIAAAARFVYLQLTEAELIDRLRRRRGHFFPAALLVDQLRELEEPASDEPAPVITVQGSRSPEQLVAQIREALQI